MCITIAQDTGCWGGAGEGLKRHMAYPGEGDVKEGFREEVAIE